MRIKKSENSIKIPEVHIISFPTVRRYSINVDSNSMRHRFISDSTFLQSIRQFVISMMMPTQTFIRH